MKTEANGGPRVQSILAERVRDALGSSDRSSPDRFDRVSRLAQQMFGVDSVQIRINHHDVQWAQALAAGGEDPRNNAFDRAAAVEPGILTVSDAGEDPRFWDEPSVLTDPAVAFFASVPITDSTGQRVGAMQLTDAGSRILTESELLLLQEIAVWIEAELVTQEELTRAAVVQRSLAPRPFVGIEGYEVAGACAPSRAVGGDFYDWYPTEAGAAFTVADVMGKGVGAAIIAATVRAMIRAGSRDADVRSSFDSAAGLLEDDLENASAFVTLFHARLDAESGEIRYVDAGHGLSFIVAADLTTRRLASTDLPLGLQPVSSWTEHREIMLPGDYLISVSDGVLDSFGGSLIGLEEIEAIIVDVDTAQEAVNEILRRASDDSGDDVTAVVVHRLPTA